MRRTKILFVLIYLTSVNALHDVFLPDNTSIVLEDNEIAKTICEARKCIRKCCPKNQHFSSTNQTCEDVAEELDYSSIRVYDQNDLTKEIDASISELFLLLPGMFYENVKKVENGPFINISYVLGDSLVSTRLSDLWTTVIRASIVYFWLAEPLMTGKLYMDIINSYNRWYFVDYFCVEHEIGNPKAKLWSYVLPIEIAKGNAYYASALIISSVFLFVVLLVYLLLPEYRKLVDLILMSYIVSLIGAFLSLASHQLGSYPPVTCLVLTTLTYFFFLSTFCWMNVMSFDIWWTFRGYAKARRIHRRGEYFKFAMYGLYAWGLPIAMALALYIVNETDLSDMPWIVKPQIPSEGCFLENGQKFLYLYVPMLILITCNWLFFLMTAFNIWRLSRGTSVLDTAAAGSPAAHRQQRNRLMVYLKLSVIMGINWLLEIISYVFPDFKIWNISDAYNLLIGVSIFFIFVCKKKIYRKLQKRFHDIVDPKPTLRKNSSSTSTLESNLTQETPLQISTNPKG